MLLATLCESCRLCLVARKLRVEYPGAIYHVMNRGDRREPIFRMMRTGNVSSRGWRKRAPRRAGRRMPKGNVRKIGIAQPLRAETIVTVKWIAERRHLGSAA